MIVVWQIRQQNSGIVERIGFVTRQVVGHTGGGVVGAGSAEVFHTDVFPRDGFDHVGAGDKHLTGLVDHDDEVG